MSSSYHSFRSVGGAVLDDRRLSGGGLILGPDRSACEGELVHHLMRSDDTPFSFLFNFEGIGSHLRLDINPEYDLLALYQIRDGIPLYLHHLHAKLEERFEITVRVQERLIRVSLNGFHIMHADADVGHERRVGISSSAPGSLCLPTLRTEEESASRIQWLCLGDGFSNARWRNRAFLSWPELVFGERNDWFNAGAAAANSRRILRRIEELAPFFENANVILATGSDDEIEGEVLAEFLVRLESITERLGELGVSSIWLATLPPRLGSKESAGIWSGAVRAIAERRGHGILDFHDWLKPHMELLIHGQYPGKEAQRVLATKVSRALGIPEPRVVVEDVSRSPLPWTFSKRLLSKIHVRMNRYLDPFPGVVH